VTGFKANIATESLFVGAKKDPTAAVFDFDPHHDWRTVGFASHCVQAMPSHGQFHHQLGPLLFLIFTVNYFGMALKSVT
jgi:hypothetical protein